MEEAPPSPKPAEAASAAPATAAAPTKVKAKVKVKLPEKGKKREAKVPKTLQAFWRARDKQPNIYVFMPDGNVGQMPEGGGPPAKLFDLPSYNSIRREEIDALWETRNGNFGEIYTAIETAREGLREAIASFQGGTGTARAVVIANQLVADEEAKLIANRSPKRWIETIDNPTTNFIDLTQRYEARKIGFDVHMLKQYSIDPQDLLRPVSAEEMAATAAAAQAAMEGGGIAYGVITDETILGLHWPTDVKVGNTQYFTAFQAILGEAARLQANQELFQSILGTRSSRTLRSLTKDFDTTVVTSEILQSVITALTKQYPEFKELLLKTGDEALVYANIEDELFSIGLKAEDPNLQNAKQWRGENLWGTALQEARTKFREKNVTVKSEEEGLSEKDLAPAENAVISTDQQGAARKAAIIHARRRAKNY